MAQSSHIPKFGNWDSGDNVPNYTVYFEKAREGRGGGKMINPNDPQENPEMFANTVPPPAQAPTTEQDQEPTKKGVRTHERRVSREEGEFRQSTESPARNDNTGRRTSGGRGGGSGRPVRQSVGSDHSIDRSPLHPQHQAKAMEKVSSYDSSHGAPVKSKARPVNRGDETPDRGAAVPKFGEWDENNPSSADNYTGIFNRVREERHNGVAGNSPVVGKQPSYATQKQNTDDSVKCCCFTWGSK